MRYLFILALALFVASCTDEKEPVKPYQPTYYDVQFISHAQYYPYIIKMQVGDSFYTDTLTHALPNGESLDTTFKGIISHTTVSLTALNYVDHPGDNRLKAKIVYGLDKGRALLYPPGKDTVKVEVYLP